jgi:hypothetical protein
MTWTGIRRRFPHQWLVVEALKARSELGKNGLGWASGGSGSPDTK